jgi:ribosome biogenesis GTPase / thiamine phosphate phosphatase
LNHPSASHPLSGYGWDAGWDEAFSRYASTGLVAGRVVRVDRGLCTAVVADGDRISAVRVGTAPVTSPDPMLTVCTGDWAVLDLDGGGHPTARALLPRRSSLVRATSSRRSEGQVLAANVDRTLVVVSLAEEPNLGRIERFLSVAAAGFTGEPSSAVGAGSAEEEYGARLLVALTKADLVDDAEYVRADVQAVAPGATVLTVSAATGQGLDVLAACLTGTSALIGRSGAGKSTLTNALAGADVMAVQQIRGRDGKGRHTTTSRELVALPAGGVVIDTPGLRGVGLYGGAEGIGRAFADIEELAADCRFDDCAHRTEPGCAVTAALADGTLPEQRLAGYRKLQRENDWMESRTDARLAAERRRQWKTIQKSARERWTTPRR